MDSLYEVQLVTAQLDALVAFYADVLGMPLRLRDERRGRVHLALGTGQLILVEHAREPMLHDWPGLPPTLFVEGDEPRSGPPLHEPIHFAFGVDAAAWTACCERLATAGIEVRGPHFWPDGSRSCYFRDPDGNGVELLEPA